MILYLVSLLLYFVYLFVVHLQTKLLSYLCCILLFLISLVNTFINFRVSFLNFSIRTTSFAYVRLFIVTSSRFLCPIMASKFLCSSYISLVVLFIVMIKDKELSPCFIPSFILISSDLDPAICIFALTVYLCF